MDNQRLLIWGFFGLLVWVTYQTWVQDYTPRPAAITEQQELQPTIPVDGDELPTRLTRRVPVTRNSPQRRVARQPRRPFMSQPTCSR